MANYTQAHEWEFHKTDKNGKILLVDGFEYRLDVRAESVVYYKCKLRKCKARAKHMPHTGEVLVNNITHDHFNDGVSIAKRKFRIAFKEEVQTNPTQTNPQAFKSSRRRVLLQGINHVSEEELTEATPIYGNARMAGYRERMKNIPKLPTNRASLILNDQYSLTLDGRRFLLGNDGAENKILVFGTIKFLEVLCSADIVYVDGTFRSSPRIFKQVFSLHCFGYNTMIPALYCLLPDKHGETYSRLFRIIQQIANENSLQFNPQMFQSDFEQGIIYAIKNVFGSSAYIKGCLFHYSQSILRKVTTNGMKSRYTDKNSSFYKFVKRLMGMPLVPLNKLDTCVMITLLEAPTDAQCDLLINYFETTYYGPQAIFQANLWNHYDTEGPRTINHIEGWHNCLNKSVQILHPNIYKLIDELKNQQLDFEANHEAAKRMNFVQQQRKYRQLELRLSNAKQRLSNGTLSAIQYLDEVKMLTKD